MDCPEHLVLQALNGRLWIWMYWRDVPKKTIPLWIYLNPLRYQITIDFGKRITINRGGYLSGTLSNVLYKYVRPHLCKWLGIHQRFSYQGGERQCHHCDTGKTD